MWADVQASPMHTEYVRVDYHLGLAFALAFDNVMTHADRSSLGALRPFVDHFGLSPRSRRTLQWEVERGREAARRGGAPARTPPERPMGDPRAVLRGLG